MDGFLLQIGSLHWSGCLFSVWLAKLVWLFLLFLARSGLMVVSPPMARLGGVVVSPFLARFHSLVVSLLMARSGSLVVLIIVAR